MLRMAQIHMQRVHTSVGEGHPAQVMQQLSMKVLLEGHTTHILEQPQSISAFQEILTGANIPTVSSTLEEFMELNMKPVRTLAGRPWQHYTIKKFRVLFVAFHDPPSSWCQQRTPATTTSHWNIRDTSCHNYITMQPRLSLCV